MAPILAESNSQSPQGRSPSDTSELPDQGQQAMECDCGYQGRVCRACRATDTQQHGQIRNDSHSHLIGDQQQEVWSTADMCVVAVEVLP